MMRFMSQIVRPLENAGFSIDDPRRSWCIMALSDTHNDVKVFIFSKRQVQGPRSEEHTSDSSHYGLSRMPSSA